MEFLDDINLLSQRNESIYDCCHVPGDVNDNDIEYVSFSGGGITGIAYAGVLKEMELRNLHTPKISLLPNTWIFDNLPHKSRIKYWLGSSAGAICAALAALGTPADYIVELSLSVDLRIFMDYGDKLTGIKDLLTKWGMAKGIKFHDWFREKMAILGWNPDLTFTELYDMTGQHLVITTTSINTFETLYLSRSSYPYMRIVDAVDSSIRIPFVYQPKFMSDPKVREGDRILIDGGVLDNLPINACDVVSSNGEVLGFNRKAIGFLLMKNNVWFPDYANIDSLLKYGMSFIKCMHTKMHMLQSNQSYFWNRIIPIDTQEVDAIDFGTNHKHLLNLIISGQLAASQFFDKRQNMLRMHGPLPKNLFIPSYRLRQNGIEYLPDNLLDYTMIYQTNP